MFNFEAHTKESREQMLEKIGVKTVDDLFSQIPAKARMTEDNVKAFGVS